MVLIGKSQRVLTTAALKPATRGAEFRLWRAGTPAAVSSELKNGSKPLMSRFNSAVFKGVHHVGLICDDLDRSLKFYVDLLDLKLNPGRPNDKLPYRGAWLMIGPEMIHLMELPNPDPMEGRPEHGGRDRHVCIGVDEGGVELLKTRLSDAGVTFTVSMSGRPAIFFRDPDQNTLEVVEVADWR